MIIHGDSGEELKKLDTNSVDLIVTDPPYGLDQLDNHWNPDTIDKTTKNQTIQSLPAGMKFDPRQGRKIYDWYLPVCQELHRVLKPGGFFFSFSAPRLYHRMTCAIEDAGFHIRDCFIWLYTQSQAKAMSLRRFLKEEYDLGSWKTPQVKSCFEPITVAQKKPDGTLLNNFLKHETGLFDMSPQNDKFPANCLSDEEICEEIDKFFLVKKPNKKERKDYNIHPTVKPVSICEFLIRLASKEGSVVLDPFLGSGTTGCAAAITNRTFIGIDINQKYIEIAQRRIHDFENQR